MHVCIWTITFRDFIHLFVSPISIGVLQALYYIYNNKALLPLVFTLSASYSWVCKAKLALQMILTPVYWVNKIHRMLRSWFKTSIIFWKSCQEIIYWIGFASSEFVDGLNRYTPFPYSKSKSVDDTLIWEYHLTTSTFNLVFILVFSIYQKVCLRSFFPSLRSDSKCCPWINTVHLCIFCFRIYQTYYRVVSFSLRNVWFVYKHSYLHNVTRIF